MADSKVSSLTEATSLNNADIFYVSQSSTDKKVTFETLADEIGGGGGSWDGDITDIDIVGGVDIGEDLSDGDLIIVDNGAGGTNRKSAMSRIWTYVTGKIQGLSAKTTPVDADILTIQDSADTNNLKELTVGNLWDNRYLADAQAIKIDDLTAADDNTDLDATSGAHGLMPKEDKVKLDAIEALADVTDATNVAAAGAVMDGDFSANGAMYRDGAGSYSTILHNLDGTTAPTADEDSGDGYAVGSLWIDVTNDKVYYCVDSTLTAAVWADLTEAAAGWDGDITDIDLDGGADIGADLADADLILVDDGAGGTNRKSAISRVWTYIWSKFTGAASKATPVSADIIPIQDTEDSNNIKEMTITNMMKALDIDGMTGIGADLIDADLFIVDDGAGGTNRSSAISRVWTYIWGKIQAAANKATAVGGDILVIQDSEDSNNAKELTLTNLKTFIDTAGTYKNIYIDAGAMVPCTTSGAATGTNEYGTNDIDMDYFAFDGGATEERVQFKMAMPEDWDRGTIKAKFFWSSAASSTAGDTVEWGIKAGAISNDDAIDAALGTPQVISDTLLANDGSDMQLSGATPALTVGGTPALGDMVVFEVYRNTDGTDDMTEDAWLFGAWIQYNADEAVSAW